MSPKFGSCHKFLIWATAAAATKWFPELVAGLSKLRGGPHVLDGEVCVLDELGRSLIRLPVESRKAQLQELLTSVPPPTLCVGHFDAAQGRQLFEQAKELKLDGLVAKRLGSMYTPGEWSFAWV